MTTYLGYTVFEEEPNARDGLPRTIARNVDRLANTAGNQLVLDRSGERVKVEFTWYLHGRSVIWDFIQTWLPLFYGQKNAVWVPSWQHDFVPAPEGGFYDDGASDLYTRGYYRRHVYAQWINTSNQWDLRIFKFNVMNLLGGNRVDLGSVPFSGIDIATGLANGSLLMSRLYLMRLETDEVPLKWYGGDIAEATLKFLEVPAVEYP